MLLLGATALLIVEAFAAIACFDQLCCARIMVDPDRETQRLLTSTEDAMVREIDVEGKSTVGDDLRRDAGDPGAFVAGFQSTQVAKQSTNEDVVVFVQFHQPVEGRRSLVMGWQVVCIHKCVVMQ